jgi:Porin PorA
MRKSTVFLTVSAIVLAGAAVAVRYVVLPATRQLPSTVDSTVTLTGTMDLFDEAALRSGNAAGVVRRDVPVTVTQRVRVESVDGATAVVSDETKMTGPGSSTIMSSRNLWAVDRTTLAEVTNVSGTTVTPHTGLVVGFPLTPEPKDYPYWDTTTQSAATARYLRAESHAGRDAYVYQVQATGAVKDPQVLATVPAALPKEALLAFAAGLGPQAQAMLANLAPLLPAQIPLTYKATSDMTFWVDTGTGYVLDVHRSQQVAADLPAEFAQLGLPTEFTVELAYTPDSVNAAGADAATAGDGLFLLGTVGPLVLLGLALILLLVAVLVAARRRARRPGPPPATPPATPPPAAPVEADPAAAG